MEEHLAWWMREVADKRIHGTTGEQPIIRFQRDEASELELLNGKPPFNQIRELQRVVHADACIEVDTNFYSVPWRLINEEVIAQVMATTVIIFSGAEEIARHPVSIGKREHCINPDHLRGIVGSNYLPPKDIEFLRPLSEYEAVVGGWS